MSKKQIEKYVKEKMGHEEARDGPATQFLRKHGYGPSGTPRSGWRDAKKRGGR